MNQTSQSFEASITRLEEIVRQLEKGAVPLEQALQLFREGTGLVSRCTKLLDQAELEVLRFTGEQTPEKEETDELPF